jgi:AcrR family transcriptional regulator
MPNKPTTTPPKRGRGRPPADATTPDVRERLLDAALTLFSEHGIAGTALSLVARKARVTPALMHYYFGNKDRLVDAVIDERLEPLVQAFGAKVGALTNDPRRAIETFVAEVIATLSAHAWLPGLWLREVVIEGGQLRARMLERLAPQVAHVVADGARRAQAAGRLNPDLEPRLLMVSLVGLAVFPVAAQSIWRKVFDATDITADTLTRHVLALLMRGLELPDETRR